MHDEPGDVPARKRALGAQIRAARDVLGMSQGELARRVGAVQSSVSNWESGRQQPDALDLLRLQEILGVHFGPAMTGLDAAPLLAESRQAMRRAWTMAAALEELLRHAESNLATPLAVRADAAEEAHPAAGAAAGPARRVRRKGQGR